MRRLKLPTITDIARRSNLSYEDVLRYFYHDLLDPNIADQIELILKASGRGGDSLDSTEPRATTTIGVILPEFIVDDYMAQLLSGVQSGLQGSGYTMTYHGIDMNTALSEANIYYEALFSTRLAEACFIISYTAPSTQAVIRYCEQYDRPYILVDRDFNEDTGQSPAVCLDNRQAIFDAMQYLFQIGHRRIGFITGLLPAPSAYFRLQGYKDALAEAGIAFDPDLVVAGNWQIHTSKQGTEDLLRLVEPPTAVVASNDVMAFSAISTAAQAGYRVPNDLSVIGFDDIEMASRTTPSLTTIRQPIVDMGRTAAEMAVALASGMPLDNPKRRFITELVIRKSTAPPHRS
jgi:LacI family transcriptional regulator